jgi:trans-aconitate 2-methyltransferase
MTPTTAHTWDARAYDAQPLPHTQWGRRVLSRLDTAGLTRVLDAGCGTGRDTAQLLELLPDVRVVGIDASASMLAQLRTRFADRPDRDRVEVIHADLLQPLPVPEPVDAIVSVAAFHWIRDHDTLFRNLATVLRPGGQLIVDCGGEGNVAQVSAAAAEVLGPPPDVWNFAGIAETEDRLRAAGLTDLDVSLRRDPARLEPGAQLESYLGIVVLGAHLKHLPEDARPAAVRAVAALLPEPVVDYVRLEIRARRAAG